MCFAKLLGKEWTSQAQTNCTGQNPLMDEYKLNSMIYPCNPVTMVTDLYLPVWPSQKGSNSRKGSIFFYHKRLELLHRCRSLIELSEQNNESVPRKACPVKTKFVLHPWSLLGRGYPSAKQSWSYGPH